MKEGYPGSDTRVKLLSFDYFLSFEWVLEDLLCALLDIALLRSSSKDLHSFALMSQSLSDFKLPTLNNVDQVRRITLLIQHLILDGVDFLKLIGQLAD